MADLHISDEVGDLAEAALDGYQIADSDKLDAACEVLQAAGPALVAAELRRLAAEWKQKAADLSPMDSGWHAAMHQQAARLLRRADELDPPQSGGDAA